jgi:hypothetical protein
MDNQNTNMHSVILKVGLREYSYFNEIFKDASHSAPVSLDSYAHTQTCARVHLNVISTTSLDSPFSPPMPAKKRLSRNPNTGRRKRPAQVEVAQLKGACSSRDRRIESIRFAAAVGARAQRTHELDTRILRSTQQLIFFVFLPLICSSVTEPRQLTEIIQLR